MRRIRSLSVLTAVAVVAAGALVAAAPAQAETATFANPTVTESTTDLDITSMTVTNRADVLTFFVEVQNTPTRFDTAEVYVSQSGGADFVSGTIFAAGGEVRSGTVVPIAYRLVAGEQESASAEGIGYAQTATGYAVTIPRTTLGMTGSLYVAAHVYAGRVDRFAGMTPSPSLTPFGPVAQEAVPTAVALGFSAPTQKRKAPPVVVTATVTPGAAGTIAFFDGAKPVHSAPAIAGVATYTLPAKLRVGVHDIRADFIPDDPSYYAPSSVTTAFTVAGRSTKTKLTLAKSKISRGTAVKATVKVSGTKTGKVVFYDGGEKLKKVSIVGSKSVTLSKKLAKGKHSIRAVFVPKKSKVFARSSDSVTLTVRKK